MRSDRRFGANVVTWVRFQCRRPLNGIATVACRGILIASGRRSAISNTPSRDFGAAGERIDEAPCALTPLSTALVVNVANR